MMSGMLNIPEWFLPILLSAVILGCYNISIKHAVRDNTIMDVLFYATLSGSVFYVLLFALTGNIAAACSCGAYHYGLILIKSLIVAASWWCGYYALRELPISIAVPIRATAPFWTFLGAILLYHEIPSLLQGAGMALIFGGYYFFSVLGRREGISFLKHKGIHMVIMATLLGACSSLWDKYLLGVVRIPATTVQFWFAINLVFILGTAMLCSKFRRDKYTFSWRWSIPVTGILLILADFLYFHALSIPEARISILALLRRTSCIVGFLAGVWVFHDRNVCAKAGALLLILAGVVLLAIAG